MINIRNTVGTTRMANLNCFPPDKDPLVGEPSVICLTLYFDTNILSDPQQTDTPHHMLLEKNKYIYSKNSLIH